MHKFRLNTLQKIFIEVFICAIIGTLLLFLVYLIPTDKIKSNLSRDLDNLYGKVPYITSIMLNTTVYRGGDPKTALKESLLNSHYTSSYNKINETDNLNQVISNKPTPNQDFIYGRYWSGYLIILKPFIYCFGYIPIYFVHIVLTIFLLILVLSELHKNFDSYILPYIFLVTCTIITVPDLLLELCHNMIPIIILVSVLTLLKNDKLTSDDSNLCIFFTFVGILTSFFDLLTFPLTTLGIPLVILILKNRNNSSKNITLSVIRSTASWFFGYIAFWMSKWIIGTLITHYDFFKDGLYSAGIRLAPYQGDYCFNIFETLGKNFSHLFHFKTIIIITFLITLAVFIYKKNYIHFCKNIVNPLFLVSLYPFAWYLVFQNHSFQHPFFAYKLLIMGLFSILSIFTVRSTEIKN